jgi:hypothetical protein
VRVLPDAVGKMLAKVVVELDYRPRGVLDVIERLFHRVPFGDEFRND